MTEEHSKPGRPRDEAAAEAIRKAALELVRRDGYRSVTIAAIARAAGVARQTLYNRWPAKADLVLDAVFRKADSAARPLPVAPGQSAAQQLQTFLTTIFSHLAQDGDTLRALIAAAQEDVHFRSAFRDRFVLPRERLVTDLLAAARDRGELPPTADPALLSAMIHGAFWYRLLNGQPLDEDLALALTTAVFPQAQEPRPQPSGPRLSAL